MKEALGWCLRHTISIVVLVFILVGVVYRQAIFGINDNSVESVERNPTDQVAMQEAEAPEPPFSDTQAVEDFSDKSAEDESNPSGRGEADRSNNQVLAESEQVAEFDKQVSEENPYQFREQAHLSEQASNVMHGVSPEGISRARQAYWMGDEAAAIELYLSLIKRFPDAHEPYGELGNILLKQDRADEAFLQYERAIFVLRQSGDVENAEHLINSLERIDSERAGLLRDEKRIPDSPVIGGGVQDNKNTDLSVKVE